MSPWRKVLNTISFGQRNRRLLFRLLIGLSVTGATEQVPRGRQIPELKKERR